MQHANMHYKTTREEEREKSYYKARGKKETKYIYRKWDPPNIQPMTTRRPVIYSLPAPEVALVTAVKTTLAPSSSVATSAVKVS